MPSRTDDRTCLQLAEGVPKDLSSIAHERPPRIDLTIRALERQDLVGFSAQPRGLRRSDPFAIHNVEAGVGRPTGDCTTLSDIDGDLMLFQLREKLSHWRNAHSLQPLVIVV